MSRLHQILAALALLAVAASAWAGSRVGGAYDIEYESLNSGGAGFATSGVVKLGGSIGQNGFVFPRTNATARSQDGFWKALSACETYPVAITAVSPATNNVRIVFTTVPSNTYTVAFLPVEGGGLTNGLLSWTNVVAGPFVAQGAIGSTTTVYVNASTATNRGRFFLIRCK